MTLPTIRLRSLRSRMLLLILPPVALAIVALTWLAITRASDQVKSSRYDQMAAVSQQHANDFDSEVMQAQGLGRAFAAAGETLRGTSRETVNALLSRELDRNPQIVATYIGYVPNAFDGADSAHRGEPGSEPSGRFTPYWNKLTGKKQLDYLTDEETSDYWNLPVRTGKDSVIEPYLY